MTRDQHLGRHTVTVPLLQKRLESSSDGAFSFHLHHVVLASKFTYGSFIHIAYDSSNRDHRYRPQKRVYLGLGGSGSFSTSILLNLLKASCLFPFLKSLIVIYKKFICRFSKFPRRRNSNNLVTGLQSVRLVQVYEFLSLLFILARKRRESNVGRC